MADTSTAQDVIDFNKYYHHVKLTTYTIRYVKIGNGPSPIFGFPGLLGSIKVGYDKLIKFLEKDGDKYTFYSWDQPGYYGSQPSARKEEDISFETEIELCHQFLMTLGHDKYTLIGWSAGGQLSLLFAMKYPELVDRILVWGVWDRLEGQDLETHVWFRNINNFETGFLNEVIKDNGMGREGYEHHWHVWMDMIQKEYTGEFDAVQWVKRFEQITCPTLFVYGDRDKIVSINHSKYLQTHIKNSRLTRIPKAPHWIQTVYPEILYNLLIDFIINGFTSH